MMLFMGASTRWPCPVLDWTGHNILALALASIPTCTRLFFVVLRDFFITHDPGVRHYQPIITPNLGTHTLNPRLDYTR